MSVATTSFLEYWNQFVSKTSPYVHPEDSGSSFLADFELSLLPIPFVGNLHEAEAIILMLNPGLDSDDIEWEKKPLFHQALVRNLRQVFNADSWPNIYLNPAFRDHPGAGYWSKSRGIKGKRDQQKFWSLIQALSKRDGVSIDAAQAHVARKVAIVQLAPYHSSVLTRREALDSLPSSRRAVAYIQELVREQSKLIIAARSVSKWGFAEPLNSELLVVYKPSLGASASLTMRSDGGQALLNHLSSTPSIQRRA
jgi:hypothetical protein